MLIHSAEITGSVQFNDVDVSNITNVSGFATTASVNDIQSKTGSYASTSSVNELQSKTGSYTSTSSFGTYTSSNDSKVNAIIAKTGSLATTGSNTFIGTNIFTGSVFITSDLIVQGSSSLQNITASAVSIGTNTVILNTNTPILQFGGISVQDSGSTAGRSGSLLWNSVNDHWINVNPSGSDEGYNSAMVINGPKNTGSLGAEVGLTTNYIPVSQGEDHITDSIIFQSGSTNIGIGTTTPSTKLHVYEALTNASSYLTIQNNRARNAAVYTQTTNGGFYAGTSIGTDTFNYQIYDGVAGAARLTISSTGAATFSSTVTTGDALSIGAGGGGGGVWTWASNDAYIYSPASKNLNLTTDNGTTKGLRILTSGAATFSSTVTTTGLSVNGTANVSSVLSAGAFQGPVGSIVTSVSYGSTTLGSYDLNNLADGMYIVTGYMVRGGAGINETYTQTWFFSKLSGGSSYVSTIANNGGPGNCYGGVSISGTTVSIGWCGQRGPAAITALRLRDAF